MPGLVVDTDVLSYLFKGDTRAQLYRRHLAAQPLTISFMTLAEVKLWPKRYRWGAGRLGRMRQYLAGYLVYYADELLCELWAEVTHLARRKGRPIEVADAWTAATALAMGVPLVTHNAADYAGVEGLTVVSAATW